MINNLKAHLVMPHTKLYRFLIFLALFMATLLPYALRAEAPEQWIFYQSDKRILTTRMPYGYQVKTENFVVDEDRALNYEEIVGRFGSPSVPEDMKTYAVKYEQTIGNLISQEEAEKLLIQDLAKIRNSYERLNGEVISDKLGKLGPYRYAEMIIEYDLNEENRQSNRTRILYTPTTKFTLTTIAPPDAMTSLRTRDFYDKFEFWNRTETPKNPLIEEWQTIEAPLKTFSLLIPQQSSVHFKNPPKIEKSENSDSVSMVFRDPVRGEAMFYSVYTYYSPNPATFQEVKKLLRARHINNRQEKRREVPFTDEIIEGRAFIQTAFPIKAPQKFPYAEVSRLLVQFSNNHIVVQELIGSNNLITSDFANTLINQIIFHPEDSLLGE